MQFEWDESNRRINRQRHNLDFADAETIFSGPTATFADDRFEYSEDRFITYGLLQNIVVVIAHTERNEMVRIISMRKATKHEQTLYFDQYV